PPPYCVISSYFRASATSVSYTLSLHDALPISCHAAGNLSHSGRHHHGLQRHRHGTCHHFRTAGVQHRHLPLEKSHSQSGAPSRLDRKSTRLNSSHVSISYAVFCLKRKRLT